MGSLARQQLAELRIEELDRELATRHLADFVRYRFKAEKRRLLWNWHLDYLCETLEAVTQRQIKRLILNMPPRYLKSEVATQSWQAWMIGRDGSTRSSMVSASFGADLASRDSAMSRNIIKSEWYGRLFRTPTLTKETESEWWTATGATRVAAGTGGTITGKGGDHLLGDDLVKPEEANSETVREKANRWLGETFRSRLNSPKDGTITIIAQRLHERDPCGYLLDQMKNGEADQYTHICIPMECSRRTVYQVNGFRYEREAGELLQPTRHGPKDIAAMKIAMGANFEGQYNQRPTKMEGGRLRPALLQRFPMHPAKIVEKWGLRPWIFMDMATKEKQTAKDDPDYSCIVLVARDKLHRLWILHVWRQQCSNDVAARALVAIRRIWKVDIIKQEKIGLLHAFRSTIDLTCQLMAIPRFHIAETKMSAGTDPVQKVAPFESALNAGIVCVPEHAPWLPDMEAEMRSWPKGAHDDVVVELGYACHEMMSMSVGEPPGSHPMLEGPVQITGEILTANAKSVAARKRKDGEEQDDGTGDW
jgi:predicted phage terminase large subunit-like protein